MKFSKNICLLLCIVVFFSFQPAVQAANVISTFTFNESEDVLIIKGTINANDAAFIEEKAGLGEGEPRLNEYPVKVTLIVLNPGKSLDDLKNASLEEQMDIVNMIDVTVANSSGAFEFQNKVSGSTGTYTAVVSSRFMHDPEINTFIYQDKLIANLNSIKNSGNVDNLKSYLEEQAHKFNLKLSAYIHLKAINKDNTVIEALMSKEDFTTKEQLKDSFEDIATKQAFLLLNDADELYDFIMDGLGENTTIKLIDEFLCNVALPSTRNIVISKFIGTEFKEVDTFSKEFSEETLFQYIKNIEYYKKVEDVLNEVPFGFDKVYLTKFKNSVKNKDAVLQKVFNETRNVQSVRSIYKIFNDGVDAQIEIERKQAIENNNPGNGNKSKNGGKSSNTISIPKTADIVPVPNNTPTSTETEIKFSDVEKTYWAAKEIGELSRKGIISGVSENEFSPDSNVTKEQLLQMCMKGLRFTGVGQKAEFTDVKETDWFYNAVAAAYQKKIVMGNGDNIFGVGQEISRQDMAVIIYRCLSANNVELPKVNGITFTDYNTIADYAKESIDALSAAKIINGMEDGSFMPEKTLTRAECAKVVYEFLSYCKML